jgi:hypothetical protein
MKIIKKINKNNKNINKNNVGFKIKIIKYFHYLINQNNRNKKLIKIVH